MSTKKQRDRKMLCVIRNEVTITLKYSYSEILYLHFMTATLSSPYHRAETLGLLDFIIFSSLDLSSLLYDRDYWFMRGKPAHHHRATCQMTTTSASLQHQGEDHMLLGSDYVTQLLLPTGWRWCRCFWGLSRTCLGGSPWRSDLVEGWRRADRAAPPAWWPEEQHNTVTETSTVNRPTQTPVSGSRKHVTAAQPQK